MIKNILVPVDGSAPSKKALEFACALTSKFSGNLYLVSVVETPPEGRLMVMGTSRVVIETDKDFIEKHGRPIIDAATEVASENGCDVTRADILAGSSAREIIDFSNKHDIDTIVMGSRGLSDIGGLLLGSVSHKVNQLATCTCITVR